ncbi:MAG TPA: DUF2061 domain-containing protein [Methylophilaceae bacterium]
MVKTVTFATIHLAVVFTLGYVLTNSLASASIIALVQPVLNALTYEKIWQKIEQSESVDFIWGYAY